MTALKHIFQNPVFRRHQFAQARARTFKGPGQGEPFLHQVTDVVPQGGFIDRIVGKGALDKNAPGAFDQAPHDGNVEVGAGEKMGHRKIVVEQQFWDHEAVDIGFVGPQQRRGMIADDGSHPLKVLRVVVELPLIAQTQAEVGELDPDIQPETGGYGDHLIEVFIGLFDDLGSRFAALRGNGEQLVLEGLVAAQ